MAFLKSNSYTGLIIEATRGTTPATGTPAWIPVDSPQVTPQQTFLRDEALRGSPGLLYDMVQGVRHDEYDLKTYLYADTFPNFIRALLGGADTVTGTTSFTHVIKVLNAPATGSQPPSYSLLDFDGANYFLMAGCQAADLTLTFGATAAADAATKWIGNPYTSATAASAPFTSLSYTTEHMIPSWDSTVTIGGTSFLNVQSGELKIDRKTAPIFTIGSSSPYVNFAGALEVTGKFTLVVATNADAFSTGTGFALGRSPEAVVLTLTDPNDITSAVNHSLQFTMSQCQFFNPKRTRGKEFTEIEVEFEAEMNTTDAATGFAPISFTAVNAVETAY